MPTTHGRLLMFPLLVTTAMFATVIASGVRAEEAAPVNPTVTCGLEAADKSQDPKAIEAAMACMMKLSNEIVDKAQQDTEAARAAAGIPKNPCEGELFEFADNGDVFRKMLDHLVANKTADAYALTSKQFQSQIAAQDFPAVMDQVLARGTRIAGVPGFGTMGGASFACVDNKRIVRDTWIIDLNKNIMTKITADTIQEDGHWRVNTIKPITQSSTTDLSQVQMPAPSKLIDAAGAVMYAVVNGMKTQSMKELWSPNNFHLARRYTAAALDAKLKPLFGKTQAEPFSGSMPQPVIEKVSDKAEMIDGYPTITASGTLKAWGADLAFVHTYVYDDDRWEIADLDVTSLK